ncbi:hypothetical protein TNIN_407931 [Trichonephila inaurata madagascariensis]|uniref:Uncharacterized protein n=1 Tax=Trichonephila inaurata madagascariensis TaxID=2747483 RepID=A0A8X7CHK5_9ARAC|nr:hypothetical protein TNIN_407931 [Trichonephila inaurata madagascariensis]
MTLLQLELAVVSISTKKMVKVVIFVLAFVAVATCSFEVIPNYSHYEGVSHHGNGISNKYFTKTEGLGYGLYGLRYDGYGLGYGTYGYDGLGYGSYGYDGLRRGAYGLNGLGYVPYGYNGLGYYGYF